MKPTGFYEFEVPANGVYRLLVAGDYFKIMTAAGAVNVQAEWGELKGLLAGQGLEDTPFGYLVFADRSGAANPVRVFVGDEKFIDGLGGTVNVGQSAVPKSAAFDNLQKTVGVASAQLLAANAARQYLLIQNNDAANAIWVAFGKAATLAAGVRIIAGGAYELVGIVTTQEVRAIAISSNPNIVTVEG